MRHTKIVATLGPACSSPEVLRELLLAGVDIIRLNFSHGSHESHAASCAAVRKAAEATGRTVAVMQDLSGPKIRTGALEGGEPLTLSPGDTLRIGIGDKPGNRAIVYTPYEPLIRSASPGDRLLLDDGRIELRVEEATPSALTTVVVAGGPLGQHKGINAPGVQLPASAVTDKDAHDLRFGLELGVDLVALSFVQTAGDVLRARQIMTEAGRAVPIVAKIERPAAVENLDAILEAAQGVMVARGDLGLEMPLEQVPRAQKTIIRAARRLGRPVIVATQVLESMRVDPRPTRAEVSDAANAVDQGVDAIMLAGETAVGAHPARAVQTLALIIEEAERLPTAERLPPPVDPTRSVHARALCEAALTLATSGHADAIVAVTHGGTTARFISALRPDAPILAATPDEGIAGALALCRGVVPVVTGERDTEPLERLLLARRLLAPDSIVVFVNVNSDLRRADANFLNVQQVG